MNRLFILSSICLLLLALTTGPSVAAPRQDPAAAVYAFLTANGADRLFSIEHLTVDQQTTPDSPEFTASVEYDLRWKISADDLNQRLRTEAHTPEEKAVAETRIAELNTIFGPWLSGQVFHHSTRAAFHALPDGTFSVSVMK